MKLVQKFQRVIAAFLLTLLLFSASVQNTVALGLYEQTTAAYSPDAVLEQAAFPAVAAAAFGVVVVGAFAYGVYTGYREASKGGAQANNYADLEMYQSDDFSQFDLQAAAS
jgi:hypothetical protein